MRYFLLISLRVSLPTCLHRAALKTGACHHFSLLIWNRSRRQVFSFFDPLNKLQVIKTKIKALMKDMRNLRWEKVCSHSLFKQIYRFFCFPSRLPRERVESGTQKVSSSPRRCMCSLFLNICIRKLLIVYSNKH